MVSKADNGINHVITKTHIFALFFFFQFLLSTVFAEEVRIAVANNFLTTLKHIVTNFEKDTGHAAIISSGSSGKLYAQIRHGAPFDVFLSADVKRPQLLEKESLAVKGSRFTYAVGRLALWSRDSSIVNGNGKQVLKNADFKRLAIANPKTAPYGTAAQSTLQALGLWSQLKGRLVQEKILAKHFNLFIPKMPNLGL